MKSSRNISNPNQNNPSTKETTKPSAATFLDVVDQVMVHYENREKLRQKLENPKYNFQRRITCGYILYYLALFLITYAITLFRHPTTSIDTVNSTLICILFILVIVFIIIGSTLIAEGIKRYKNTLQHITPAEYQVLKPRMARYLLGTNCLLIILLAQLLYIILS